MYFIQVTLGGRLKLKKKYEDIQALKIHIHIMFSINIHNNQQVKKNFGHVEFRFSYDAYLAEFAHMPLHCPP